MPNESIRCQFIDPATKTECETWYPFEPGEKFCNMHRVQDIVEKDRLAQKTANHNNATRTTLIVARENIAKMNEHLQICEKMPIQDLVLHIQDIESQIKNLERDLRAANLAKRNLEDRLTDEERAALRKSSRDYKVQDNGAEKRSYTKKSPEEKAKGKLGFNAWAAKLGLKTEELMLMDDDEMAQRIAKYKASKG